MVVSSHDPLGDAYVPYVPLNALKPFGSDIWIVDGAPIGFHYFGITLPVPTRMTIVRLSGGDIWVHSPTAWNHDLASAIERLGPVRHLVAPSTLHYWYLPEWQARFPQARSYGPPGFGKNPRRLVHHIHQQRLPVPITLAQVNRCGLTRCLAGNRRRPGAATSISAWCPARC